MADGFPTAASRADVLSDAQTQQLSDNLDPKYVKGRKQGGQNVNYIEGWHAIKEANRIFGFGAWERELIRLEQTNRELLELTNDQGQKYKQWRVGYLATVRIIVHGEGGSRHRDGTGFGTGMGREANLGDAIESATKEAETDAMKRALSTFGNPFGLALYDKKRAEVGPSKNEDAYQEPEDEDAGSSDAGQREQPKSQQATGADATSPSAPVKPAPQTMSKANARADFTAMVEEIRACESLSEIRDWGKRNVDRIKLQPTDWVPEIRKEYADIVAGFEHLARTSREAEAAFAGEER